MKDTYQEIKQVTKWALILELLLCLVLFMAFVCPKIAKAEEYSPETLANAIFKAENSVSHPYGILAHYKHTTPRQACINTIKHALGDWNGKGDFIEFLASRYAPVGTKNDPKGLNRNWVKNVKYFLKKGA